MAAPTTSTNFGWLLPTEGGSSGTWDTLLNELISGFISNGETVDGIDDVVKKIKTTADAALSRAGGSMTGEIDIKTERYLPSAASSSGTVTLDLAVSNFFHLTPSSTVTFAFSNVPASPDVVFIQIEITNGAAQTVNWPSSVDWPGGSAPTLTAGVDVVTGYTRDGGTTWRLALAQENSS